MQRGRNQAWGITGFRQVETQFLMHEIHHALGWRRLAHVALLPSKALETFLKVQDFQRLRIENYGFAVILGCTSAIQASLIALGLLENYELKIVNCEL